MEIFVAGVMAGIALAIPLGPMAILLISTTIKHGRKIGVFGALAMASVDFSYAAVVFAFGNVVISFLTDWVFPLRVLGSLILLYVGIKIFVDAQKSSIINSPDLANSPTSRARTYAKFFGLTVLNPATAFYFFGISPSVAVLSQGTGFMSIAYFAVGVFLGSIVWQLSLVVAANLTKALTSAKIQHRIQYAGALLIVALALGLILK